MNLTIKPTSIDNKFMYFETGDDILDVKDPFKKLKVSSLRKREAKPVYIDLTHCTNDYNDYK